MDFIYTDFTFKYAPWPAYCLFNITTKATFNSMEISCWDVLALSCFAALAFLFKLVTLLRSGGSNKFPPGPKPWPIIGNMNLIRPLPHRSFHKLSQKYGPLMQLKLGSVPVVIVASAEMAKQFLKDHDHIFATRPQTAAGKYTGRNYSSFLWAPYGPQWRLWRKICQSELFSSKRLDSYEYIRMEEMKALMSSLYASLGKPIVLEKKLSCFTFSLMSRIVLGKRYFNDSRYNKSTLHVEEFKKMAQEFMKLHGAFNIGDWIPWLEFFDLQGYVRRMKTLVKNFDQFFDFVYDEHKVNREREKDFFEPRNMAGLLLELMDDPNLDVKLTYDSVKALTQDLMVGGIETTSSTLEWAVSELIKHPHLIEKATEELDKVVGRERWVEEKDIPQLPYIDAIMKETMRKHPPSAMLPPHAALEDCEIGGFQVEDACPGVVSCADVLALAARDSVSFQFKKSMWEVLTGRRDGKVSSMTEALRNIPSPFMNFTQLKQNFAAKNLTLHDLVVLSGGHTIGISHCNGFGPRVFNFTGKGDQDPSLDPNYAKFLKTKCNGPTDTKSFVELDPNSSLNFDTNYYSILLQHKGLLLSDAALITNKGSTKIVKELVETEDFFTEFAQSMKRMGAIEVLTGTDGEIRKHCWAVNS